MALTHHERIDGTGIRPDRRRGDPDRGADLRDRGRLRRAHVRSRLPAGVPAGRGPRALMADGPRDAVRRRAARPLLRLLRRRARDPAGAGDGHDRADARDRARARIQAPASRLRSGSWRRSTLRWWSSARGWWASRRWALSQAGRDVVVWEQFHPRPRPWLEPRHLADRPRVLPGAGWVRLRRRLRSGASSQSRRKLLELHGTLDLGDWGRTATRSRRGASPFEVLEAGQIEHRFGIRADPGDPGLSGGGVAHPRGRGARRSADGAEVRERVGRRSTRTATASVPATCARAGQPLR